MWFRDYIPTDFPWGDESLLKPVPPEHQGEWGVRMKVDKETDEFRVTVGPEAIQERLKSGQPITAIFVPYFDRLIPMQLTWAHRVRIRREDHLARLQKPIMKSALICAGAVGVALLEPQFKFPALLGGTMFGLFPLIDAIGQALIRVERLPVEELHKRQVNHLFFFRWMRSLDAGALKWGTAVLGLVFLYQMFVGMRPSLEGAALVKASVLEHGEWWRLITTGLMHGNFMHVLFNGLALFSFGKLIRALASPAVLAFVFLVTVITGSLASLYFGSAPVSVGASGGILGCLGFLLVVGQKYKNDLPIELRFSLIQTTLVVAIFGLLGSNIIDNAAHAGGLVGGLAIGLIGWPILKIGEKAAFGMRALGWASTAILALGVVKVVMQLWATTV